jgi:hypothetical protein
MSLLIKIDNDSEILLGLFSLVLILMAEVMAQAMHQDQIA